MVIIWFIAFVFLIIILLAISVMNSRSFEVVNILGTSGEHKLYRCLLKYINNKTKIVNNILLPKGNNSSNFLEIDAILINECAIMVFEMKDWNGAVYGTDDEEDWTIYIDNDDEPIKEYKKYNPIIKNNNHIKYLKKFLKPGNYPIYNIVVFGNNTELDNVLIGGDEAYICNLCFLDDLLNKIFEQLTPSKFLQENMDEIYNQLNALSNVPSEIKMKHLNKDNSSDDK